MNKKRKAVMVMAMFFSVGAASLISAGPAMAMPPNCDFYVCEEQGGGGGGDGGTTTGGGGAPQPPTPPGGGSPDGGTGGGTGGGQGYPGGYPQRPPLDDLCDIEPNTSGCRPR